MLLVGAFPVDLAKPGTSAASVGLVNCVGYAGAAAGDVLTGALVDRFGWRTAIFGWAVYAFVAALLVISDLPQRKVRFRISTLLIATTLVAVGLELIVRLG